MRHAVYHVSALVLALVAAGERVRADTAYEARIAKLPPAPTGTAFALRGDVVMAGRTVGRASVQASLEGSEWIVQLGLRIDGKGDRVEAVSVLQYTKFTPRLEPIEGRSHYFVDGLAPRSWTWSKDGGLDLKDLGAETSHKIARPTAGFLTSAPSFLLFAHLVGHEPGTWRAEAFDVHEKRFFPAEWTTGQRGKWKDRDAKLVSVRRGDGETMAAGFEVTTGELLGLEFFHGGRRLEVRPTLFTRTAGSAKEVAAQAVFALTVPDFLLLERIVHWPTVHQDVVRRLGIEPEHITVKGVRTARMLRYQATLTPTASRDVIARQLAASLPDLETSGDEKRTVVRFGPAFQVRELVVGKREGKWCLLHLPPDAGR